MRFSELSPSETELFSRPSHFYMSVYTRGMIPPIDGYPKIYLQTPRGPKKRSKKWNFISSLIATMGLTFGLITLTVGGDASHSSKISAPIIHADF